MIVINESATTDVGLAAQALAALRRHVLEPLAPRIVDHEYGGFLVDFDDRWRAAGPHDKTLEHAARTTLAFALLDEVMPGEGCDQLVRHGCKFLQTVMWDSTHEGFFVRVDRSGRPRWEGLKHPHAVTYVAEAFLRAARHLPTGEGAAWADRALAWLDDVAWDPLHGGYWGSYRRDNSAYRVGSQLPTADGRDVLGIPVGFKEVNTQGDAIEMLTAFVARGRGGQSAGRLAWLVDLVSARLSDQGGVLPYLYRSDWRVVPDLVRVGLQLQMVHRLIGAMAVLGGNTEPVSRAAALADFVLTAARHPDGGFCFAVTGAGRTWPATSRSSDLRQWWVQLEAVRAFHGLAMHDAVDPGARARFRASRNEQWRFVRERLLDERHGGILNQPREPRRPWRWRVSRPTRPVAGADPLRMKTHGWKDPLHEVGTFIALSRS